MQNFVTDHLVGIRWSINSPVLEDVAVNGDEKFSFSSHVHRIL